MGRVSERVRNPAVEPGADLRIQLLGAPTVPRGGLEVEAPPGRKHWGLLTYLVRTEVPSSRERLSGLLFPEADDPLGALRSALSALRRQLGPHAEVGGNPVRLALGPGSVRRRRDPRQGLVAGGGLPPGPRARAPRRHGLPVEPRLRELARERAPPRRRDDRRRPARGGARAACPRRRARGPRPRRPARPPQSLRRERARPPRPLPAGGRGLRRRGASGRRRARSSSASSSASTRARPSGRRPPTPSPRSACE